MLKRSFLAIPLVAVLSMSLLIACGDKKEAAAPAKAEKVLRVGTNPTFAPFEFQAWSVVRIAEINGVLTFFRNGHSGDSEVNVACGERGNQTIEAEVDEFNFVTHLFAKCFS